MKLKYKFVTNPVADKIVAVVVGDDMLKFNGYIKMNETGAYIFNLLQNDITEEEIFQKMNSDFDNVTEEKLRSTIKEFIEKLKDNDVLE